jgi:hypothetical protein
MNEPVPASENLEDTASMVVVPEKRPPESVAVDSTHRVIVALAAISLLGPAVAIWSGIVASHSVGIASVVLSAGALAILVASACVRNERAFRTLEVALLALGLPPSVVGPQTAGLPATDAGASVAVLIGRDIAHR